MNGKHYASLQAAVDALGETGGTIELKKDVTLTAPINVPVKDITVNGNGNTITLPSTGLISAFNNTTGLEGLKTGTSLTVNDVTFQGNYPTVNSGFAVVTGFEGGVTVNLDGCAFNDLYSAVYANPVTDTTAYDTNVTITSSTFEDVKYSYSLDNGYTAGALTGKHVFNVDETNTGAPEPETFAIASAGFEGGDLVGYTTLQAAVDAAAQLSIENGKLYYVILLDDITVTEPIQVPAGAKIRFYGNGYANGNVITLDTAPEDNAGLALFSQKDSVEGLKKDTLLELWSVNIVGTGDNKGYGVIVGGQGGVDLELHMCDFQNLFSAVYCQAVPDEDAEANTINIEYSNFEDLTHFYSVDDSQASSGRTDKHEITLTENTLTNVGDPETFAAASVNGKGYDSFTEAVDAAQSGDTVTLLSDVAMGGTLVIDTDNIVLDLNGHTISGLPEFSTTDGSRLVDVLADGVTIKNGTLQAGAGNKHTLNLYDAKDVTLVDLTIDGSQAGIAGAPLVLGGSTAKLEGTTTVKTNKANSWYGINVDSKNGVGSELTVNGQLIFNGENQSNVGIYVENQGGAAADAQEVTFGTGSSVQGNGVDGFKVIYIAKDTDNKPQGTVEGAENAGLITNEDGNYIVKPAPAPQPQQPAGGSSHKHNYTWQHSDDEHWQYCADCGQAISNGPHTLQWKDGYQECTVCGYRVGSSTAAAPAAQASAPAAAAPAAPAAPAAVAIPQTGDASDPMLWVVLLAVSGSALGALVYTKKKREE